MARKELKVSQVKAITVTQLARRIRNLLEIEIGETWVEGEVSNLRKQASGHWYFSLKDQSAQISCAMFSARRRGGAECIEDGAKVQVFGETSFYEARGSTQLIVKKVQPVGKGDLQAQFEALKKKLDSEGLFDQEKKKALPFFPKIVGIVTSPTGAALQDMMNVLSRRAPWLTVVLFPAAVQGKGAENGIAAAIHQASEHLPRPEVLIVGRGGGSMEDLWNFNEEVVARAIAESQIPIMSAVGHEIDFTIADFVSDLRAPTPSAAAELAVPDRDELLDRLRRIQHRFSRHIHGELERLEDRLDRQMMGPLGQSPSKLLREPKTRIEEARSQLVAAVKDALYEKEILINQRNLDWQKFHPHAVVERQESKLKEVAEHFRRATQDSLENREQKLNTLENVLRVIGPEATMKRGFSVTLNSKGEAILDASKLRKGARIKTITANGEADSIVEK